MTENDRLVRDYLRQLRRAARGLPRSRRHELIGEITTHIAEARASEGSDRGVPAILERLGDPRDIVRSAGGPVLAGRPGGLEIAAVILLLVGGFAVVVGWVAGCVLLWVSPRWRWPDKLLGTLIWPGGLLAPVVVAGAGAFVAAGSCSSSGVIAGPPGTAPVHQLHATCAAASGPPAWLGVLALIISVAAPVAVAVWLLRRARRLPEPDPAETTAGAL